MALFDLGPSITASAGKDADSELRVSASSAALQPQAQQVWRAHIPSISRINVSKATHYRWSRRREGGWEPVGACALQSEARKETSDRSLEAGEKGRKTKASKTGSKAQDLSSSTSGNKPN